ncbi:MAG: UDP-3-O-acyl-N-acetylglucosamine deacetylase [Candidatus Omnitrophica bacterium]|nr:UDP-3-O-acyl-N-acetylglucosamine deacetylase [Candidatus Omnitrophota bacterium]
MEYQHTISKEVAISGVGLHTNKKVNLKIKPAGENHGIVFKRTDIENSPLIPAHISCVLELTKSLRRTSVGINGVEVHTIEHLMASFAASRIDNLLIEIDGIEVPGLDGSASPFLGMLKESGIVQQSARRKVFQLKEPVLVEDEEASLMAFPSDNLNISYLLNYEHPQLKAQYIRYVLGRDTFAQEVAPSRTFCLEEEAERLTRMGLGKGADYTNTLVVGNKGLIDNTYRLEDEPARHKVLDLIGDLYLLGCGLEANIVGIKSGHPLNIRLARRIQQQSKRFMQAGIQKGGLEDFKLPLGVNDIKQILPHREPFLFVDSIIEIDEGKSAVGIKHLKPDEYFFKGHFPGRPVMPGVLIVEAMAQVSGILMLSQKQHRGKLAFFMGVDNVRFRKPVVPGDVLRLESEVGRLRTKTGEMYTKAFVDGKVVAEATLLFALVER